MREPVGDRDSALLAPRRRAWLAWCSIAAYSYSFFAFGLQVNLLGPTAGVLARKLGVVEADLGLIFTLNGLASIVGGVPSGWLVDKMPGHAVLAAALAFEAAGFVAIPFCSSMPALALAFGLVALSWNLINTAGNTYVLYFAAQRSGGSGSGDGGQGSSVLINAVNALFGVGSLAAPLLAEVCATRLRSAMAAYWITAALIALSAVTFVLLPSPKPPGSSDDSSGSSSGAQAPGGEAGGLRQPLLGGSEGGAAGDAGADAAVVVAPAAAAEGTPGPAAAAAAANSGSSWSQPVLMLLGVLAVFNLLNVGTEVGFGGWIFTYGIQQAGLSEHQAHTVNAAYWGAFTSGRIAASFAAMALSPVTLLLASLPLAMAGAATALLAPAAWMQQQASLLLLGVTVLVGLGVAPGFANALALLDSYCPCTGSITGLLGGVAGAGCMTVPLLVALLAKHTALGYQGLMWVSLGSFTVQLLCVPVALLLGSRVEAARAAAAAAAGGSCRYSSITKDLGLLERQPAQPAQRAGADAAADSSAAAADHC